MSELKVYHHELRHNEYEEFYLKYEADKVIAELKDNLGTVNQIVKASRELLLESQKMHKRCADNAAKIIRHQKYKRCLAMAWWCEAEADAAHLRYNWDSGRYDEVDFYEKWHKRWLELAEKFKEAK